MWLIYSCYFGSPNPINSLSSIRLLSHLDKSSTTFMKRVGHSGSPCDKPLVDEKKP